MRIVELYESSDGDIAKQLQMKYNVTLGLHGRGDIVTLSKIIVPPELRNSGIGSAVMSDLVNWADANHKIIALTPSSDFGGNKSKLIKFYKRFGFVDNKGSNKMYEISELMYRMPK